MSGIRAARTYMLSSLTNAVIPSRPDPEVDGEDDEYEADLRRGAAETAGDSAHDDEERAASASDYKDGKLLVRMYSFSVQACACSLPSWR